MGKVVCKDGTVIVRKTRKHSTSKGRKWKGKGRKGRKGRKCPKGRRGRKCRKARKARKANKTTEVPVQEVSSVDPISEGTSVVDLPALSDDVAVMNDGGRRLKRGGRKSWAKAKSMWKNFAKVKNMMARRRGIFAMLDCNRNRSISPREMFKPFSSMDSNGNMSVTEAEFSTFMNKAKRPICMYLKRDAEKRNQLSWIQMGSGITMKGKN